VYEGQFKNGLKHGEGILTYKNGVKYEGQFQNDKKAGVGYEMSENEGQKMIYKDWMEA
jgi:hypothetical protein